MTLKLSPGLERNAGGESHEGVAVGGVESDPAFEQFLDEEPDFLGLHGGAAAENAADAGIPEFTFSASASSSLGVVKRPVTFRCLRMVAAWSTTWAMYCLATSNWRLKSPLHEPRIEVDEVAGTAADIGEVLDGEAQAAGPVGPIISHRAAAGKCASGSCR